MNGWLVCVIIALVNIAFGLFGIYSCWFRHLDIGQGGD